MPYPECLTPYSRVSYSEYLTPYSCAGCPTPNALLCIAGCPTPSALLCIAGCPTPNALLHIDALRSPALYKSLLWSVHTVGVLLKELFLKNSAILFTGEHLYWSFFLTKLQNTYFEEQQTAAS